MNPYFGVGRDEPCMEPPQRMARDHHDARAWEGLLDRRGPRVGLFDVVGAGGPALFVFAPVELAAQLHVCAVHEQPQLRELFWTDIRPLFLLAWPTDRS